MGQLIFSPAYGIGSHGADGYDNDYRYHGNQNRIAEAAPEIDCIKRLSVQIESKAFYRERKRGYGCFPGWFKRIDEKIIKWYEENNTDAQHRRFTQNALYASLFYCHLFHLPFLHKL